MGFTISLRVANLVGGVRVLVVGEVIGGSWADCMCWDGLGAVSTRMGAALIVLEVEVGSRCFVSCKGFSGGFVSCKGRRDRVRALVFYDYPCVRDSLCWNLCILCCGFDRRCYGERQ